MLKYILKRLLLAIPVVLGIVTIVFILIRIFAPNPAVLLIGEKANADRIEQLSEHLGLNEPIWKQYVIYMGQLFRGDLGVSYFSKRPVLSEILNRMPATIELALVAVFIASVIGVTLGVICAVYQNSWLDRICQVGGLVGVSMPRFWLGFMLMLAFAVNLKWLPVSGRSNFLLMPKEVTGFYILDCIIEGDGEKLVSTLKYLALPSICIAVGSIGSIMRYTRSTMLETIRQDYIRTARAKGLSERVVVVRHALKNALIPVVTVIGMELGGLFSGSVLTESVFAWPGVGKYVVDGINNSDYTVVQGGCILVALIAVVMNLLVDLLYGTLDPRIRY